MRRAVGSTPVIMGKKLKQYYHSGPGYFELDIDVASSRTASGVISIVRGATRSLTVDLAILIEGMSHPLVLMDEFIDVLLR